MIINNFLNDIFLFVVTIVFDEAVFVNIASMIKNKKTMMENFEEGEEEKKRKHILKMVVINGIFFHSLACLSFFLLFFYSKIKLNFAHISNARS
jgi:hypothetical protein